MAPIQAALNAPWPPCRDLKHTRDMRTATWTKPKLVPGSSQEESRTVVCPGGRYLAHRRVVSLVTVQLLLKHLGQNCTVLVVPAGQQDAGLSRL